MTKDRTTGGTTTSNDNTDFLEPPGDDILADAVKSDIESSIAEALEQGLSRESAIEISCTEKRRDTAKNPFPPHRHPGPDPGFVPTGYPAA